MKKRNVFLMILIPVFLIGIACIVAGIALGGTMFSYELRTDENNGEYQTNTTTLSSSEADTIHGIDYNIRTSEVKLVSGDHFSISGNGRYQSYIEDGIWHIKTAKKTAYITFLNHHIDIPHFWNHSDNISQNTITIPDDISLKTASINVAAGAIKGEELHADDISLKIGAGTCTLEQLTAKNLSVKVGAGDTTLRSLWVSDSCVAKVGAGDLVLGSKKMPAGTSAISHLEGKCAAGNMTVSGKITGDSRLECSMGGIDVLLDGYRRCYNINSQDSLGSVSIKENTEYSDDKNHHHDDENHPHETEDDTHYGNLSLKCAMGDITVKFQQ